MPLFKTSLMRRMVASSDCRFRFVGGRRSIPLEIACGLVGYNSQDMGSSTEQDMTHASTRTDQARFAGSEQSVDNRDDRVPAFKVFESVAVYESIERIKGSNNLPAKPSFSRSS